MLHLVYHNVRAERAAVSSARSVYAVTPAQLVQHIQLVQQAGWSFLNPRLPFSAERRQAVMLTFDDGTVDHYESVLPVLQKQAVPALFYISSAKLDQPGYLTRGQVRDLWQAGYGIGSHSHTHRRLDHLSVSAMHEELALSRTILADIIGQAPDAFAPPGGFYSHSLQTVAREQGFAFFRTMRWGYNRVFDPMSIEVLPMTARWGEMFLALALRNQYESLLRSCYALKNVVRTWLPPGYTRQLRSYACGNRAASEVDGHETGFDHARSV